MTDNRTSRKNLQVEVRVPDVDALFDPPGTSPMSSEFRTYSQWSGLEYIASRLYADRRARSVDATFVLPPAELASASHAAVEAGIRQFARSRIEEVEIEVRADSSIGRRALVLGLGVAIVMLSLAASVARGTTDGFGVDTVVLGLEIGAWVAVWFPLERVFWGAWSHRRMRRDYEVLRDMEFTLVPGDPPPRSPGSSSATGG